MAKNGRACCARRDHAHMRVTWPPVDRGPVDPGRITTARVIGLNLLLIIMLSSFLALVLRNPPVASSTGDSPSPLPRPSEVTRAPSLAAAPPVETAVEKGAPPSSSRPGTRTYDLYAHVTAYHDLPGDRINGGPLNFMGRRLVKGRSAAGPSALAGLLLEVPDFNPANRSESVSPALRSFIRRNGYDGFFVIDDIGRDITFLEGGRASRRRAGWSLEELSRHSLLTGEVVADFDIMVPDRSLAERYRNTRCLVRLYRADVGDTHWIPSRDPVWKGRKPYFDTSHRYLSYREMPDLKPLLLAVNE